jgi:hypothetical protein
MALTLRTTLAWHRHDQWGSAAVAAADAGWGEAAAPPAADGGGWGESAPASGGASWGAAPAAAPAAVPAAPATNGSGGATWGAGAAAGKSFASLLKEVSAVSRPHCCKLSGVDQRHMSVFWV